jgi:4-nitrophenyl phosphatase/phosphoglycolate phosphatase
LIDGIPETLAKLRAAGKRMFFVTNNSTKSRAGYKSKFDSLGLDIPPEEIFSSSFAAAAYLEQSKFKESGKKVYIIGEVGICEELDLIDVPWIGGPGKSFFENLAYETLSDSSSNIQLIVTTMKMIRAKNQTWGREEDWK